MADAVKTVRMLKLLKAGMDTKVIGRAYRENTIAQMLTGREDLS